VHGEARKFRGDPLWRDHVLFHEYFHGDIGAGIGPSHQIRSTGLIAPLMAFLALNNADSVVDAADVAAEAPGRARAPSPQPAARGN